MISRLLESAYTGKVPRSPPLKNAEITSICLAAREVFLSQPTLIELSPPVKIVGDVHGQFGDLIRMFEMCGFPPAANFLFLGDYVDRGKQSLETILLVRFASTPPKTPSSRKHEGADFSTSPILPLHLCSSSVTRSSTPKTSSSFEATMRRPTSPACTASTTSASGGATSRSGRASVRASLSPIPELWLKNGKG